MTALFWFTNDLRLTDNPGLAAAVRDFGEVIPLYILAEQDPWAPAGAGRWWLHHSLTQLQKTITAEGGTLLLRRGDIIQHIVKLVKDANISAVYFSRAYEPWLAQQQHDLFIALSKLGVICKRFGSRLLLEPDQILNLQGKPFQVFTPFYKHALKSFNFAAPAKMPKLTWASAKNVNATNARLDDWQLLPTQPNWAESFALYWQPGEQGAQAALKLCMKEIVATYPNARDFPALEGTSRLSPALHFGDISPRQIWHAVSRSNNLDAETAAPFLRQLIWREFSYYLLHHWPHIPEQPFKPAFADFSWKKDAKGLRAWQKGKTGYPIVDAGMRELWQTGWMHNRVRMIVASFLTKHLRIHWLEGAKWFWDTLLDADLANNSAGWQWVAGSGADAAPYFRIFNPTLQGEKFDPDGEYIRRWLPELSAMPNKYIHTPWLAPENILNAAKIKLGRDYPAPIVDHKAARDTALEAYQRLKS
jgi:deoxyribodipyrimidine photo-lyase